MPSLISPDITEGCHDDCDFFYIYYRTPQHIIVMHKFSILTVQYMVGTWHNLRSALYFFPLQYEYLQCLQDTSSVDLSTLYRILSVSPVFSSRLFWTSSSLDVPAGVTQEEGNTGFLIHLPSVVHAFIFLARRIQPFLSLVDREVEFCLLTI